MSNEVVQQTGIHRGIDKAMGVTKQDTPTADLTPTGAQHLRSDITWYGQYGGATGAMVGSMMVLPGIIGELMGVAGYLSGDPVWGTVASAVGTALLGGFVALGNVAARADRRDNRSRALRYEQWQTWLRQTYGLELTDEQNNELVNQQHPWYGAQMSKALTWGKTTIVHDGATQRIQLIGDAQHGYQVMLVDGHKSKALTKRQLSTGDTQPSLAKPDAFPGYDRLPSNLHGEVSALHQQWSKLAGQELGVEDRFTVDAIAADYLPESLALLDKFTDQDRRTQLASHSLFLEQVAAMRDELTAIATRTQRQDLKRMQAHTLFLKNRKSV